MCSPQFVPGPDSPAWLAAMGEADEAAELYLMNKARVAAYLEQAKLEQAEIVSDGGW